MKKQTLALCVITKDEEKNIKRLLDNICGHVDKIYITDTGSTDQTLKVVHNICKDRGQDHEVSRFEWTGSFADARNYNFEQAKEDWILWLDADDTVEHPEKLREYINQIAASDFIAINLPYRYEVSEEGIDKTVHDKDRIFRNGLFEWTSKAPIHENAFMKDGVFGRILTPAEKILKIRHWATAEDLKRSGERNIKMLEDLAKKEGDKPDPRTVFYLGREYHAQNYHDKAKDQLVKYLGMVDSGHERSNACDILAHIESTKGNYKKALEYGYESIRSAPDLPAPYINVASHYAALGEYALAIEWVEKAITKKPKTDRGEVQSPFGIQKQAVAILFDCYASLEQYEKAAAVLKEYNNFADDSEAKDIQERMADLRLRDLIKKQVDAFVVLANSALGRNRLESIKPLIEALPESVRNEKAVLRLKRVVGLGKQWTKGNIAIFCGHGYEEWDQSTSGIGGSETAVIEVARRLKGYNVTIYGSVEEKRVYDHVTYLPAEQCDFADRFDIFISWRNPILFKIFDISAKKKYLWLHDVPNPEHYTREVVDTIDKILVMSKFHRSLLPAVPDEKFYMTRNGIDLDLIKSVQGVERKPHKIIYSSSADRGLETLLDMMPDVLKEVPDAELVWSYGWEVFDKIRTDADGQLWKKNMQEKMKAVGAKELGRLGKVELYKQMKSARIWAYPTNFPEISCITCMEAQACGCFPITSGYAALESTQTVGVKEPDLDIFKQRLIQALKAEELYMPEVLENGWDELVEDWKRDLFHGDFKDAMPLVSVVCTTIRPGVFRVLREQLEKQTYQNFELIVIDGRFDQRQKEVRRFFGDFDHKFIYKPDPERDKKKYPYGLCHAHNAALSLASGELLVFLQDFIEIPKDGLEKFVNIYKNYPDRLSAGVDYRYGFKSVFLDKHEMIDVFGGKPYELKEKQYTSQRIRIGKAVRATTEPMEWELNWCAAPRSVLLELGGWDETWDSAFGYDNTELALRFVYLGGIIMIDETNRAKAISHWDIFPNDDLGVPDRNKKTNDARYATFVRFLSQANNAKVKLNFKEYYK